VSKEAHTQATAQDKSRNRISLIKRRSPPREGEGLSNRYTRAWHKKYIILDSPSPHAFPARGLRHEEAKLNIPGFPYAARLDSAASERARQLALKDALPVLRAGPAASLTDDGTPGFHAVAVLDLATRPGLRRIFGRGGSISIRWLYMIGDGAPLAVLIVLPVAPTLRPFRVVFDLREQHEFLNLAATLAQVTLVVGSDDEAQTLAVPVNGDELRYVLAQVGGDVEVRG
jgi:hypothetical protein